MLRPDRDPVPSSRGRQLFGATPVNERVLIDGNCAFAIGDTHVAAAPGDEATSAIIPAVRSPSSRGSTTHLSSRLRRTSAASLWPRRAADTFHMIGDEVLSALGPNGFLRRNQMDMIHCSGLAVQRRSEDRRQTVAHECTSSCSQGRSPRHRERRREQGQDFAARAAP